MIGKGRRLAVEAMQQAGALIGVGVAGQHQIDAMGLEDRHDHRTHVGFDAAVIGIVAALAVGRVMPGRDGPFRRIVGKVAFQPGDHPLPEAFAAVDAEIGVEHDDVDVPVVEGVVGFGAGSHTAGDTVDGKAEHFVVGAGLVDRIGGVFPCSRLVRFVVADNRPDRRVAQYFPKALENRHLILPVEPRPIGVVAEQQHEVGALAVGVGKIGIADRARLFTGLISRIAQHPDSRRHLAAGRGRGLEKVISATGDLARLVMDRIVVARRRRQPPEPEFMLDLLLRFAAVMGSGTGRGAEIERAAAGTVSPPANDDLRIGRLLQIGAAHNPGRAGRGCRDSEQNKGENRQPTAISAEKTGEHMQNSFC